MSSTAKKRNIRDSSGKPNIDYSLNWPKKLFNLSYPPSQIYNNRNYYYLLAAKKAPLVAGPPAVLPAANTPPTTLALGSPIALLNRAFTSRPPFGN
uniref:Uncharacterized protein n=1 Tax=Glossina austeni TaxID=7395 RepID=A0A1A9VUF0_GLOAU